METVTTDGLSATPFPVHRWGLWSLSLSLRQILATPACWRPAPGDTAVAKSLTAETWTMQPLKPLAAVRSKGTPGLWKTRRFFIAGLWEPGLGKNAGGL